MATASFGNCSIIRLVFFLIVAFQSIQGLDTLSITMTTLGGLRDSDRNQNSVDIEELARFAVDEHNKKSNALLEFARLVKAKEQTVTGTLYYLTLEAIDAGKKKLYEAKVWVKLWINYKELQEFKHIEDVEPASFTSADLGVKDGHKPGWRAVPIHDPAVKEAAIHAVKAIQGRSNSLAAYELLEIQHAKAEVIEDTAKFDLMLKLGRGATEEKFKVEVHKNVEGAYRLSQMQQEN